MRYLFLLLLAQDQATFRSDVALVHVDAEVRQGVRLVDGLQKESFVVTDDGKRQKVAYFGHQEEPLDVILLFDTREGMRPAVARVAEAAHTALGEMRQGDRVAVMAFDCKTDLIVDFTGDFRAAEQSVGNQVLHRGFKPGVDSCSIEIVRALSGAAQLFLKQPRSNRRRAIVIVTHDKGTGIRPDAVRRAVRDLWQADAVVVGVIVRIQWSGFWIGPPYHGAQYAAEKTGGDTQDTDDAAEGLRETIRRLRSRYSLYYVLPQGRPGRERKIRVELTAEAARRYPGATIRARSGYVVSDTNR